MQSRPKTQVKNKSNNHNELLHLVKDKLFVLTPSSCKIVYVYVYSNHKTLSLFKSFLWCGVVMRN